MTIEELERKRKNIMVGKIVSFIIFLLIIIVFYLIFRSFYELFADVLMPFIVIISIPIYSSYDSKKTIAKIDNLKKEYNKYILSISAQNVLSNVEIDVENGITKEVIKATDSITTEVYYSSKNYIKGDYNNIHIELSDVSVECPDITSDSNKDIHSFYGQWIIVDYKTSINSNVQIIEKKKINRVLSISEGKFIEVHFEDMDFEKKFKVITSNEENAYYLITPSMIEKLKELELTLDGAIIIVFVDNKLHIGLYNSKVLIDVDLYKKVDCTKLINICTSNIKRMMDIYRIFSLKNDKLN